MRIEDHCQFSGTERCSQGEKKWNICSIRDIVFVKASKVEAKASRRFCSVVVITPDFDSTIIPATPVRIWARPHE